MLLSTLAFGAGAQTFAAQEVQSEGSHPQQEVPITFGQVFKVGAVPRGTMLRATLDGHPVALQVDAKATNPDGSLRHAVLTVMVPALAPRARLPLMLALRSGSPAVAPGAPVTLAQLLATGYDADARFTIAGVAYRVDARSLLRAVAGAHVCKPWGRQCNLWLSGPLASAWIVHGPAKAADGTAAAHLEIYFAVRAYAGTASGTVGKVRTDIVIENSNAYAPQGQPQYVATLTSGSASYTTPALTQYAYTRWHHVLWWNGAGPAVYLRQDTRYIQDAMAVSRYMALTPDEQFLASVRQTCAPLQHCDQTQHMGQTGAQPAIGPLPRWTSVYIVDPDPRAYYWMLANTDALGAYGIHYRDAATGYPLSIHDHPYATQIAWGYANKAAQRGGAEGRKFKSDLLPNCVNNAVVKNCATGWYGTGNPNAWDNAHQPAESYVPYMVTGSWYYLSELAFGASQNEVWSNPVYRGYAQGLIDRSHSQLRGKAWTLRDLAEAAWLLPDQYPLKAEFNADVHNALADWNTKYSHNPSANPLHVIPSGVAFNLNGGVRNAMPAWEHSFLTWSAQHAAELGFAGAREFRDWLGRFDIGIMTDWITDPAHGYCWLGASQYLTQVKDVSGNWLPSYTAVYAANFPSLVGRACNSPAMIAALGALQKQPWQAGQMTGYADSATGFPSNLQLGLAAIADSGLPYAAQAWEIFSTRKVQPSGRKAYDTYPNFAVLPRTDRGAPPHHRRTAGAAAVTTATVKP